LFSLISLLFFIFLDFVKVLVSLHDADAMMMQLQMFLNALYE